ncbi:hypothetical protein [Parasediminibacterium sp. JCM 36343]|uniref:hypothetical protein n=1 Tax=Parasediminibacterium sp. JCM 36343 TaxID=3374279 RepID=UPI0039796B2C
MKYKKLLYLIGLLASLQTFGQVQTKPTVGDSLVLLKNKVGALPQGSQPEKWKKVVFEMAIEQAENDMSANLPEEASVVLADIAANINKPPSLFVAKANDVSLISALKMPKVKDGNPYIERLVAGAKDELKKEDIVWGKITPTSQIFKENGGAYGSRATAVRLQAMLWLLVNPASPMGGDPELFKRFLRRYLAYVDGLLNGKEVKAGQQIFDDFAIAPASCALREFAELFPNLLLPSQQEKLKEGMKIGARVMYGKAKDRQGDYANIDIALSYELLNFGLFLHDDTLLAKSKFLMEVQAKNIYADGAVAYKDHQNESHAYHDADVSYLSRYYEVTGDEKCFELLRRTEWYGPVSSGRLGEFWTVPSWKGTWNANNARPCGGEPVASITGNPYLRWILDLGGENDKPDLKNWPDARPNIGWYRNDIKPVPLPENYTVIDRNICGPRAWYGQFNYAATVRDIPDNEPGIATIMGLQATDNKFKLSSSLMSVYSRIRTKKDVVSKDGSINKTAYAWLTSKLKSSVVMGKDFSAVAGSYQLHQYGSSTKGPVVDWKGMQLWLGLPDRVIGLLGIEPLKDQAAAYGIDGVISLVFGGTALAETPKKIKELGNNEYAYGDLIVKIHDHNYKSLKAAEVPFRLPKAPITEILMQDEAGEGENVEHHYPLSTNYHFIAEIKTTWAKGEAIVKQLPSKDGVIAFQVYLNAKQYTIFFNGSTTDATLNFGGIIIKGIPSSIHLSTAPNASPLLAIPKSYLLPAGQSIVIVSSKDAKDHEAGWENMQEMLKTMVK